ncbi:MAG: hypothetical protein IIB00_02685 [candidate division Zixibacteria bacterium]|nr:hypothetical protein [candidate division Zixibacteria bacterium]
MLNRRLLYVVTLGIFSVSPLSARNIPIPFDTSSTIRFGGDRDVLPNVIFELGRQDYLSALNPDLYPTRGDVRSESRWVRRNWKPLSLFWRIYGDSVLTSLVTYSGIPWSQDRITIHIVRYFGEWESISPATIPIGGKRTGAQFEAAPSGAEMYLHLIHALAHQLLAGASKRDFPELKNPLTKASPFHLERLVELLALTVAVDIFKRDDFLEMTQSESYANRRKGVKLFFDDMWGIWILSERAPLISYLRDEPRRGQMVFRADSALAALSHKQKSEFAVRQRKLPHGGQMGLALEPVSSGLRVTAADPERLAFAYGIFEDDILRSVNGKPARDLREFYREFLNSYESTGANLKIRRGSDEFIIQIKLAPMSKF